MKSSCKTWALLLAATMVLSSLLVASVSAQTAQKPQKPTFTMQINDHSYDEPAVYQKDQFTGETVLVKAAEHYEWRTLHFTIQNQPHAQGDLYYNFRYRGQYAENWTTVYYENRYVKAETGSVSCIPFLISGQIPSGQGNFYQIHIPEGATVDFEVQALIGTTTRGSSLFASGEIFTGEASEWSNAVTINFTPKTSANPSLSVNPITSTNGQNPTTPNGLSLEYIAIIGLTITILVIAAAFVFMYKKNYHLKNGNAQTTPTKP